MEHMDAYGLCIVVCLLIYFLLGKSRKIKSTAFQQPELGSHIWGRIPNHLDPKNRSEMKYHIDGNQKSDENSPVEGQVVYPC